MDYKEFLTKAKEIVGLAKAEEVAETEAKTEVVLSTKEVAETKVDLAEEEKPVKKAEPVKEVEQIQVNFATSEELSEVKQELLSMIKALIEDKADPADIEVPQKLSKEEIDLSVEEEIIHSPENKSEQKVKNYINKQPMSTQERVAFALNN
tara:strand:+ start:795 stop:1247 length:453 start_codon:yes stop_codon:yes gene_type:complete